MPHLQGFIKGWFGSWKEEARDKNSITKITGKYSFSFTTQKEITQYCRAKITFIECSLSRALYMATD